MTVYGKKTRPKFSCLVQAPVTPASICPCVLFPIFHLSQTYFGYVGLLFGAGVKGMDVLQRLMSQDIQQLDFKSKVLESTSNFWFSFDELETASHSSLHIFPNSHVHT